MRTLRHRLLAVATLLPSMLVGQSTGYGPWHLAAQRSGVWLTGVDSVLRTSGASLTWRGVPLLRSGGDPGRRTPDGRAGLWALHPSEAHRMGLRITPWIDERLDPMQSTAAVLRHGEGISGDTLLVHSRPTPMWPLRPQGAPTRLVTARFLSLEDIARVRGIPLANLISINRHLLRGHTVPGGVSTLYLPPNRSTDLSDIPDVRLVGVVALHHGTLRDLAVATQVPMSLLLEWNPEHASYRRGDVLRVPSTLRHATTRAHALPLATVR